MVRIDPLRVVIDTNVWISILIGGRLAMLRSLIFSGAILPIFSSELLTELHATVRKPKLARYNLPEKMDRLMSEGYLPLISCEPIHLVTACRDKNDNFLLALAIEGKADYLLTGDKDLLCLHPFNGLSIVQPSDFLEIITTT